MEQPDAELIVRLRKGDVDAFDALFATYRKAILAYVRGLLGIQAQAEEVTQDVFLELVRSIDKVDPKRGASAWLYRVARNRSYDILRRRKFEVALPDEDVLRVVDEQRRDDGQSVTKDLEQGDLRRLLDQGLDALDPVEREILVLHYFNELPFREIARLLKRPLGTVLWKSRRSLEKLAAALGDMDENR